MPLRLRRGTNAERLAYTPVTGELIYTTDTKLVYVGDGTTAGGVAVGGGSGSGITDISQDLTPELGGNLDLAGFEINGIGDIDITGIITATGNITAANFLGNLTGNVTGNVVGTLVGDIRGSVFADDSSLIVDGITGYISTNVINYNNSIQFQNLVENNTGNILFANTGNNQIVRFRRTDTGTTSDQIINLLEFQQTDDTGTSIYSTIGFWHSGIYIGHDQTAGTFTADNYVGIRDGGLCVGGFSPTAGYKLDVKGNTLVSGEVEAAAFKGSLVLDDSTIVVDGITGDVFANTLISGALFLSASNIDTTDSSPISITPSVTFNSDVVIENDLTVTDEIITNILRVKTIITEATGTPELSSDTDIILSAGTRVEIASSPFKLASFSTGERDALSAQNGDMIYNTTANKFQGYAGGVWVDLH